MFFLYILGGMVNTTNEGIPFSFIVAILMVSLTVWFHGWEIYGQMQYFSHEEKPKTVIALSHGILNRMDFGVAAYHVVQRMFLFL